MSLQKFALPFAIYAAMSSTADARLNDHIPDTSVLVSPSLTTTGCGRNTQRSAALYQCESEQIITLSCPDLFWSWGLSTIQPENPVGDEFLMTIITNCPAETQGIRSLIVMALVAKYMQEDVIPAVGSFLMNNVAPIFPLNPD